VFPIKFLESQFGVFSNN